MQSWPAGSHSACHLKTSWPAELPTPACPGCAPAESVAKLAILNTPLSQKTPLRPELAAYKNPVPFLRPKAGSKFAGDLFNAAGGPYAMTYRDAQAYDGEPAVLCWAGLGCAVLCWAGEHPAPPGPGRAGPPHAATGCGLALLLLCRAWQLQAYAAGLRLPQRCRWILPAAPYQEEAAASEAIASIMAQLDWPALLRRVDEGYQSWRQPSLVLHGTSGEQAAGLGSDALQRCAARLVRLAWCRHSVAGCTSHWSVCSGAHEPLLCVPADQFIPFKSVFEWLESKRTCMRMGSSVEAKLGHMPQVGGG